MSAARIRERAAPKGLSIGALSRATQIPVETLRTWERRYGAPVSIRRPSGHRIYPPETVGTLRKTFRLLAQGHRAAQLLGLGDAELDALLALSGRARASEPARASAAGDAIPRLMHATRRFDRETVATSLHSALSGLGLLTFLERVAAPFMVAVGEAWREGRLDVCHEHFASGCLRDFLAQVRNPLDHAATGPRVAAAMLPGDGHEGGLLMACALLAHRGCRVTYLGLESPVTEIAAAARGGGAEAVAISVSTSLSHAPAIHELERLRGALPARLPVWLGGHGAPEAVRGVERFETLERLNQRLDGFV